MFFNNPYTAAPGTKLDNIDNTMWEGPIPQNKKRGLYTITQVYCNGTIRIQRGSIYEHIKTITRLTPYIENHKVKPKTNQRIKMKTILSNIISSISKRHFVVMLTSAINHMWQTSIYLKSLLLKTLLTSLYAFTHRVLLQTSMHPYSTGESDISSSLV